MKVRFQADADLNQIILLATIRREPTIDFSSPGLLIIPQSLAVAAAVEDLILIWSATEANEWINRMSVLPL